MSNIQDDELILLWLQGAAREPDPAEIARLAGLASTKRFDRSVYWRNFAEYTAGLLLFAVFVWNLVAGYAVVFSLIASACVAFVLACLWWQHRNPGSPDPAADSRSYQAAMLARIDKQIRLHDGNRFWYLMPLSIPLFWSILELALDDTVAISLNLVGLIAIFAIAAWLNESWGIRRLRAERAKIEAVCGEFEGR